MMTKMNFTSLQSPDGNKIADISNINVIVGRNGAGKSRLLRSIANAIHQRPKEFSVQYISPERGGVFQGDGNIANTIERNPGWLHESRSKNQVDNFKAASATRLRDLEVVYQRRVLADKQLRADMDRNFKNDLLAAINSLLPNISIVQAERRQDLEFFTRSGQQLSASELSSGESEVIALASEVLYFFETLEPEKGSVLLLDEPDVHLHPDLQARLAQFLVTRFDRFSEDERRNIAVVVSTHSTALVAPLAASPITSVGVKYADDSVVQMQPVADEIRKIGPFFGHPLSLVMSRSTPLIVEGEDDERVWRQATRTSKGAISVFPIEARTVSEQTDLENFCARMLAAIYDDPLAYSIRDGDGKKENLEPIGPVKRMRLNCYEIENALLADDCLESLNTNWPNFKEQTQAWIDQHPQHHDVELLRALIASDDRLRDQKIKRIRVLIAQIAGKERPWEVTVGQAIGRMAQTELKAQPFSLADFLGEEIVVSLVPRGIEPNASADNAAAAQGTKA